MEMKISKTTVGTLNQIAKEDFEYASAMLDGINLALGTKYGWLNMRVVWFENPDAGTAEKYAHAHDAYAWAE